MVLKKYMGPWVAIYYRGRQRQWQGWVTRMHSVRKREVRMNPVAQPYNPNSPQAEAGKLGCECENSLVLVSPASFRPDLGYIMEISKTNANNHPQGAG